MSPRNILLKVNYFVYSTAPFFTVNRINMLSLFLLTNLCCLNVTKRSIFYIYILREGALR